MIQKKYYEKLFLHIKGYIQFDRFFNETTEYQLPWSQIQGKEYLILMKYRKFCSLRREE